MSFFYGGLALLPCWGCYFIGAPLQRLCWVSNTRAWAGASWCTRVLVQCGLVPKKLQACAIWYAVVCYNMVCYPSYIQADGVFLDTIGFTAIEHPIQPSCQLMQCTVHPALVHQCIGTTPGGEKLGNKRAWARKQSISRLQSWFLSAALKTVNLPTLGCAEDQYGMKSKFCGIWS